MEPIPIIEEQQAARHILASLCNGQVKADDIKETQFLNQDLGIDSFQFVSMILEVEKKLNRKVFSLENLPKIKTVGDLMHTIREKQ